MTVTTLQLIGVFTYFSDIAYAERRRTIENYNESYRGLSKLFLPRNFFEDFAARHALKIHFADNKRAGYVNAAYTYHCFMERS